MGGCRCTYRSCMVKSDGKTHMFHYPVFDKIRCHQWLINAHRLEYLNLKVSQLKNRVVCQHHFKEQYFMNFKKEKLTFDAIPTEDGPYCDLTKWVDKSQEFNRLYPIVIEDIENDYFPINDKKANFSVKYIDFLTNSENIETPYQKNDINILSQSRTDNFSPYNFVLSSNIDEKPQIIDGNQLINIKVEHNNQKEKSQKQPIPNVPLSDNLNLGDEAENKKLVEIDVLPDQKLQTRPRPKVRIISEKKITSPVPLTGNFEPVSPSVIVNLSKFKRNNCAIKDETLNSKPIEDCKNVLQLNEPVIVPRVENQKSEEPQNDVNAQPQECNDKVNSKIFCNKETKISNLKNKLSPERVAAIREKRKFNMRLKDIIESVIKAEEPEKINTPNLQSSNENKIVKASKSCNNDYYNNNEVFLANLEARMTRMENLLLNKIDQNTQRFMDLKKSIVTRTQKKRSISTQTITNEEAHKRYLYSEISKYLGAESNNLIYQELFINKFAIKSTNQSVPGKRRKYR